MSAVAIVGIIIAGVVVLALGFWLVRFEIRRRHLRDRFGPEYDRIREDAPGRRAAEQELTERERRHVELGIQPISTMSKDRYTKSWALIQATFVDQPTKAVDEADRLVVSIMQERGYPYADYDERVSMLSVEHGAALHHYRAGHDIRGRHADSALSTEDLRAAMVHYRTFIEDLLESRPAPAKLKVVASQPVALRPSRDGDRTIEPPARPVEVEANRPAEVADDRVKAERAEPDIDPDEELITHPKADTSMRPNAETRPA